MLKLPPSTNYQGNIVFLPGLWDIRDPQEGTGYCPFDINWGDYTGLTPPYNNVSINLANNVISPQSLSQIAAMTVDNSRNAQDVIFVFQDTFSTITIPGGSPNVTVPVFTRSNQLYVYSPGAQSGDETSFLLHNVMPPPVAVPESVEQTAASIASFAGSAVGTDQIIPLGTKGTLEAMTINTYIATAGAAGVLTIEDGSTPPKVIWMGDLPNAPATTGLVVASISPMSVGFSNGVVAKVSGAPGGSSLVSVNLYYKTP